MKLITNKRYDLDGTFIKEELELIEVRCSSNCRIGTREDIENPYYTGVRTRYPIKTKPEDILISTPITKGKKVFWYNQDINGNFENPSWKIEREICDVPAEVLKQGETKIKDFLLDFILIHIIKEGMVLKLVTPYPQNFDMYIVVQKVSFENKSLWLKQTHPDYGLPQILVEATLDKRYLDIVFQSINFKANIKDIKIIRDEGFELNIECSI